MAKGTKTPAKVQQQRDEAARIAAEAQRADNGDSDAGLFDATAYDKELQALRDKHTTALRKAIEDATAKRDEAEAALTNLQRQLDKILGVDTSATIRKGGSEGGGRGRMKREEKERLMAAALSFLSGKEGAARSEIATALSITPAQAATVLKALREGGKADSKGEKANARWFAK